MNIPILANTPVVNILILAAGQIYQHQSDDSYPSCLTEIGGVTVLERIVRNTQTITNAKYVFTFLESEVRRYHLEKVASLLVPNANCKRVPEKTQGSLCTALLAACQLSQDNELLIISTNELVDIDLGTSIHDFHERDLDAGTLTFHSLHPRYSYVLLDENNLVIQTTQRQPISPHATAGVFWFARTSYFVEAAKNLIRKDSHVDGSYFVAPTFNELILLHKNIGVIPISADNYIPLKNERQLEYYTGAHRS